MRHTLKVMAVAAGLGLGGCALPLAVTIATSVAQLAITASTGKGPTDHLISAAMMEDCVLFRVIEGDDICIETPQDALMQRPDGVYMRVEYADGSSEIAPVTKIQPVHAYSEMPESADAQQVIDAIRNSRPSPGYGAGDQGVVYESVSGLPAIR